MLVLSRLTNRNERRVARPAVFLVHFFQNFSYSAFSAADAFRRFSGAEKSGNFFVAMSYTKNTTNFPDKKFFLDSLYEMMYILFKRE